MSTDYFAGISIGYRIRIDTILKIVRHPVEEKSHEEKRFDPLTGEFSHNEKVIDQEAGWVYRWGGKEYEDYFGGYDDGVSTAFSMTSPTA